MNRCALDRIPVSDQGSNTNERVGLKSSEWITFLFPILFTMSCTEKILSRLRFNRSAKYAKCNSTLLSLPFCFYQPVSVSLSNSFIFAYTNIHNVDATLGTWQNAIAREGSITKVTFPWETLAPKNKNGKPYSYWIHLPL